MTIAVLLLIAVLAAANGANDVSKGVATLRGSGLARYRTAILWGAVTTLAGSLLSAALASNMLKVFTGGAITRPPTVPFEAAALCGVVAWIVVATVLRLPVSTTHGLIGALIGAGLLFAPSAIAWNAIVSRLLVPLLASIVVAYAISAIANAIERRVLAGRPHSDAPAPRSLLGIDGLHWLSAGGVGFARGLNDTPKIVSLGVAVHTVGVIWLFVLVAVAMFAGSLVAGSRVAKVLAEELVTMNHREGFTANLTTALLVGFGANLGLPMSTTHVSTGAIAGIGGGDTNRLNKETVVKLLIAWTVTPVFAAVVAALAYFLLTHLAL
ncbi:MAG: phosphate transporter [Candidatus Eremiobacteraeota bacterium]|nr:phosphate transporter [Candidatus Eremiobacteraeota bacterium]